jgi:hypothetical protein
MSIGLFINTNAGFRGITKTYIEFQNYFEIKSVSFCCIRQWVLRLGYGLMIQKVEKRSDWIYILDFSIQLGKERCLLILGVTRQSLVENGYELKHHQVRVLDIFVQEHFDGEAVYQRLISVRNRTGIPYQIISDKGNDVKKGVELFCNRNKQVIDIYDITHMIGICIKHRMENDIRWLNLQKDLCELTQQVKQSDVSFLRPIAISKKARWLNIKQEIEWLEDIYNYERRGDFSLICKGYKIKNYEEIFERNKGIFKNKYDEKRFFKELKDRVFEQIEDIPKLLENYGLMEKQNIETIDAGKARFEEKFAVLNEHKTFFYELKQLNTMAENIKGLIRNQGLSMNTLQAIEAEYDKLRYEWIQQVFYDINNRLQKEHSKCGIDQRPILCCSEIIESVFGKFKMKAKQTVGGIYETVLSIVLFCSNLTEDLIQEILTSVKMSDVDNWFRGMAGVSNLAKRRIAFC